MGFDEVFIILTLILNDEDDEPSSTRLTCLALGIISSGIDNQKWCDSHRRFAGGRHLESNPIILII